MPPDLAWDFTLSESALAVEQYAQNLHALTQQSAKMAKNGDANNLPEEVQRVLAEDVRAVLDLSASLSGAFGDTLRLRSIRQLPHEEVQAACIKVQGLLHLDPIVHSVREFVSRLLYLGVTTVPKELDAQTWGARDRLSRFLYLLCGRVTIASDASASETVARSCSKCSCCQIALQEGLSLLRYIHQHISSSTKDSESDGQLSGNMPLSLGDGLGWLLEVLRELVSALHVPCFEAVHAGRSSLMSGSLEWKSLHDELQDMLSDSWQSLPVAKALSSLLAAVSLLQKRAAVLQAQHRRRRFESNKYLRQGAGFVRFPPALMAIPQLGHQK